MAARFQIRAQPNRAPVHIAEVVRLVHQHGAAVLVDVLQNYAAPRTIDINVAARFLVELRFRGRRYDAVRHYLRAQSELFVHPLPHRAQTGGAEYQRRPVLWIAYAELAQQFGAYVRLAESTTSPT